MQGTCCIMQCCHMGPPHRLPRSTAPEDVEFILWKPTGTIRAVGTGPQVAAEHSGGRPYSSSHKPTQQTLVRFGGQSTQHLHDCPPIDSVAYPSKGGGAPQFEASPLQGTQRFSDGVGNFTGRDDCKIQQSVCLLPLCPLAGDLPTHSGSRLNGPSKRPGAGVGPSCRVNGIQKLPPDTAGSRPLGKPQYAFIVDDHAGCQSMSGCENGVDDFAGAEWSGCAPQCPQDSSVQLCHVGDTDLRHFHRMECS